MNQHWKDESAVAVINYESNFTDSGYILIAEKTGSDSFARISDSGYDPRRAGGERWIIWRSSI